MSNFLDIFWIIIGTLCMLAGLAFFGLLFYAVGKDIYQRMQLHDRAYHLMEVYHE